MGARASARAWLPHGRAPRPRLCCTASLSVTRALIGATSIARFAPMNAPVRHTQRQIKTHKKQAETHLRLGQLLSAETEVLRVGRLRRGMIRSVAGRLDRRSEKSATRKWPLKE